MSCHHSNSRRFKCACGAVHEWGPANEICFNEMVCDCGRLHQRSPEGPHTGGNPIACEGVNPMRAAKSIALQKTRRRR